MNLKNKEKQGKAKIICWFLTLVLLFTSVSIPVTTYAASEENLDAIFSSGSQQVQTSSEEEIFTDSPQTTVEEQEEEIIADEEEAPDFQSGTEEESQSQTDPDVMLFEETAGAEGTPPDEVMEQSVETGLQIGDTVRIVFADNSGDSYGEDMEIITKMGESIVLPQVPDSQGTEGSGWKLSLDTPDEDAIVLEAGEELQLSPDEDIDDYILDGVLTFYAVQGERLYTVNFYNNSGTAVFSGGQMKVAKGTTIIMPDFSNSKYVNFGWTDTKSGRTVKYEIGEKYTVTGNINFYIIRYSNSSTAQIKFTNPSGQQNADYKALDTVAVIGSKMKLPAVPTVTGYTALGWATKKNATTAKYLPGQTVTVQKNIVVYAVLKKVSTYTVLFNNNSGTSTSSAYKKLNQKVAKNSYIILPEVPQAEGYQNLGWTTTKNGTTPLYKEGTRGRVTKNMKFYAVRRKSNYYTVSFYLGNGSSNSEYKSLQMKVEENDTITLPGVPERDGYVNMGWSTKKNSSSVTNREGTKYTVTKNISFYAVQSEEVAVTLHYSSGAVYKVLAIGEGNKLSLPGMTTSPPYTMMGWSTTPNQTVSPQYEVGEVIQVNQSMHLYAVTFNRNNEEDITADSLAQADLRRYKQVIFVGDSRTHRMENTLNAQFGTQLTQGVTFISQEGGGLEWLQESGYTQIMQAVGEGSTSILDKSTAIIFNLGVNDLASVSSYISYMKQLGSELKAKGCKLYYMSVNPVNNKLIQASGKPSRPESSVRSFNASIKSQLCSSGLYTYIDTYSYLMKTGYGTDASTTGIDIGIDDGLHYTSKTYKRIYQYCMKTLNSV